MIKLMMILHEGGPFGLVGVFFNLLFFIGLSTLLAWDMMRTSVSIPLPATPGVVRDRRRQVDE